MQEWTPTVATNVNALRGARLAPSTFPFFFASDASGTDVEASGDDTHVKLYLQGYGCIVYVSVGDNYGDDTNALWGSCNGEMEIGICPFQDHFNQKWHFHFLIH